METSTNVPMLQQDAARVWFFEKKYHPFFGGNGLNNKLAPNLRGCYSYLQNPGFVTDIILIYDGQIFRIFLLSNKTFDIDLYYFKNWPNDTCLSSNALGLDPCCTKHYGNVSHVLCDNTDVTWYQNLVHWYSGQF